MALIVGILAGVIYFIWKSSDADVQTKAFASWGIILVAFLTIPLIFSLLTLIFFCWEVMKENPILGFVLFFTAVFFLICSVLLIDGRKKTDD